MKGNIYESFLVQNHYLFERSIPPQLFVQRKKPASVSFVFSFYNFALKIN